MRRMLEMLLLVLAYAVSTVAFYYGVVCFCHSFLQQTTNASKWWHTLLLTVLNFTFFTLYGMLRLGLILNWAAFLLVFYLECRSLFKISKRSSLFLSLNVCLFGLSTTLFNRAVLAIILDVPLSFFDNAVGMQDDLKVYPVVVSYLFCFFVFTYCSKEKVMRPVRHLLKNEGQMRLLILIMLLLMGYLLLQFFLYGSYENNLITKIWSLVSCCYMCGGLYFSIKYATRVSYLYHLGDKNMEMRKILSEYKSEEKILRKAATSDTLTGLLCQAEGKESLRKLVQEKVPFSLCIVDLDGLKYINDNMGHASGDVYLLAVTEILKKNCRYAQDVLCRYGGDEFVLGFVNLSKQEAAARMKGIEEQIEQKSKELKLPMNISYGIAQSQDQAEADYAELFAQADTAMYEMKRLHKQQSPNIVRF